MPLLSSKQPLDPEILDADQAAQAIGCSRRTLLDLARNGRIPGTKLGNKWRFLRTELRQAIRNGSTQSSLDELLRRNQVQVKK